MYIKYWILMLVDFAILAIPSFGADNVDTQVVYWNSPDGGYCVNFTLTNNLEAENIYILDVYRAQGDHISSISGPIGWSSSIVATLSLRWHADYYHEINPGETVNGYRFITDIVPNEYD